MEKELKKKLYEDVACIGLWIIAITLLILFIAKYFFCQTIDLGIIKDVFSISATVFAALVAVLLFSDWRIQKQYDIEREKLELALIDIAEVNRRLLNLRNDMYKIQSTWDYFSFYPEVLKRNDSDTSDLLNAIYIRLKHYKYLSKDENIIEKAIKFQASCNTVFGLKAGILREKYKTYIEAIYSNNIEDPENTVSYQKDYNDENYKAIRDSRFDIHFEFKNELSVDDLDENKNVTNTIVKDYNSFIKDAINEAESLSNYCIDKINLFRV